MEADLDQLEQKLATLIAHTRALRAANEGLRRDLAASARHAAVRRPNEQGGRRPGAQRASPRD
jgi:hypothetical protein